MDRIFPLDKIDKSWHGDTRNIKENIHYPSTSLDKCIPIGLMRGMIDPPFSCYTLLPCGSNFNTYINIGVKGMNMNPHKTW